MSRRHRGILSRLRRRVKENRGGRDALQFLEGVLLLDPCVYCFEYGCDSLDHITPISSVMKTALPEGMTIHGWMNLAPTHHSCNSHRGSKGVLWNRLSTSVEGVGRMSSVLTASLQEIISAHG